MKHGLSAHAGDPGILFGSLLFDDDDFSSVALAHPRHGRRPAPGMAPGGHLTGRLSSGAARLVSVAVARHV